MSKKHNFIRKLLYLTLTRMLSVYIHVHNISLSNITLNNNLDSDNIATRVKARNEKARKMTVHKKPQHFKTWNLGNTSSSASLSHEY